MLKKVDKGIWFNTETGHYQVRFTYKNYKTGEKTRPHLVAQIKLDDGTIRYAKDKEEAKLAIAQYIANGGPIEVIVLKENTALLSLCIEEYIKYCCTLGKARTDLINNYCEYFLKFLAEYYYKGDIEKTKRLLTVGTLVPNDFYNYMAYRQRCKIMTKTKTGEKWTGRYVSNATIAREMNSIKGLFRYLKQVAKVIKENPCEGLEDLQIEAKVKQPPTLEQERKIMELASSDFDFFVMLIILDTLGVRKGEVLNLLWENVHLEMTPIFPFGFIDFVKRKNRKNLRLPLSAELQKLIKELPKVSNYVFTNPKTGTKYTNRYRKLNRILEAAGVKELGVGYHIFRHNTAANLESSGVEVSVIKDILGNSSNVVLNNYLNQGVKRKQEVIDLNSQRIKKLTTKCNNIKSVQELSKI